MDEAQIPKYYANKKILVTGGSGLMGKVLIWKLLKSCPAIDTIYVLIRSKYGKSAKSRKEDIFGCVIFDEFKKNDPEFLEKIIFISGDVGEDGLGLSDHVRNLFVHEISIIFHGAAMLKMDANLKASVNINILGTLRILQLAEQMKKLEAFVYISTAYCCCENKVVEEKLYPVKDNPHDIINLTSWMNLEMLDIITPKLIEPLPNTYAYTKRLTESLLEDFQGKIPLIVARPTIVIPAIKDPIPGWNDSLNGPIGLMIAAGTGVTRTTLMHKNTQPNLIPVDVAVNGILTLPWANSKEKLLNEVAVYNVGQTEHESLTWFEVAAIGAKVLEKNPLKKTIWYPNKNSFTDSIVIYTIKNIFLHWLPAYVIDFIMLLIGQKTFMVRAITKLQQGEKVLRYFGRRQWTFVNDKLLQIKETMNDSDKQIFPVTMKELISFEEYFDQATRTGRQYLLKEEPNATEFTRKKAVIMYYLDKFVVILRYIIFVKILMVLFNTFLNLMETYQHKMKENY